MEYKAILKKLIVYPVVSIGTPRIQLSISLNVRVKFYIIIYKWLQYIVVSL